MQHRILDVQLNKDRDTTGKENAITTNTKLRRFCMNIWNKEKRIKTDSWPIMHKNMNNTEKLTELLFRESSNTLE